MSLVTYTVVALLPILAVILYSFQSASPSTSLLIDRASIPIIVSVISHYSHAEKVSYFARALAQLGYPVTFLTGSAFEDLVANTTVTFKAAEPAPGFESFEEMIAYSMTLPFPSSILFPAKQVFVAPMPQQMQAVQELLGGFGEHAKQSVHLHDQAFFGGLPQLLGLPGLHPAISMSVGVTPLTIENDDAYAFPAYKVPDTSPNRIAVHRADQARARKEDFEQSYMNPHLAEKLESMGVTGPYPTIWNAMGSFDQYVMQIGIPEFDFPRSKVRPIVKYMGVPHETGGSRALPPWWPDLQKAKTAGKKIVVISQGSALPDLQAITVPTLKLLADRDDLFVIATTVVEEPETVANLTVPPNARVTKFIPFDLLLPQVDLVIAAGGYGTVMHSIKAGVPMILAGVTQDKAHVGTLANYTGVAVDLKTGNPTMEQIRAGVNRILGDGKRSKPDKSFVQNAKRLSKELKKKDPVKILDETIQAELRRQKLGAAKNKAAAALGPDRVRRAVGTALVRLGHAISTKA